MQTRAFALASQATLVKLFKTQLRPLVARLEALALSMMMHPQRRLASASNTLFLALHWSAGRAAGSAAWARTIEGLVATANDLSSDVDRLLDDAGQSLNRISLSAGRLVFPSSVGGRSGFGLQRGRLSAVLGQLERLVLSLSRLIAGATAGPVTFPIGAVVGLSWRLIKAPARGDRIAVPWTPASVAGRLTRCGSQLVAAVADS